MSADRTDSNPSYEAVASFATKTEFRDAVSRLLGAGFAPSDLSVLATHESLEIAGNLPGYPAKPGESLTAGLTDEIRFLDPLTDAGIVFLSGGPIAAAFAALVGAGLGGAALKEFLDRYTANRDSGEFAAALKQGSVLLWVRVADSAGGELALKLLSDADGRNAHLVKPSLG